ncbi:Hsp70 family protein [Spirillospora sp. NBC_00431]
MSITAGIDLGTTNSCISVPEHTKIPDRERLLAEGRLVPVGGALVITDEYRSPITPSVVWLDEDGAPIVGDRARSKARITGEPPPAMFFKRTMGTDVRVLAGHAELTSQQASALVLRHLKELAEEVLGTPVEQAVVTVPAFFEMRAKTETVQAGEEAGFTRVETLTEPFAAALTALHEHRPDASQNFLVYDLGGGTFDVSVVSWSPGAGFEHLAFEGDRFLGGYEFDKALVRWIADRRPGYDLRLDSDEPEDARLLARLLVHVEAEKHNLSRLNHTEIAITGETDRWNEAISIKQPVSRAEFEELIDQDVRRTLESCDTALRRAGLGPDDLDEIIMVGGSSRVPLVGRLLGERFGREPRLIDPDLCVAVGAGIRAGAAPVREGVLEVDQVEAVLPATDVAGRVHAGEGVPEPGRAQIHLRSADGQQVLRQQADAEGRFVFDDVELLPGVNEFTLAVIVDGQEAASRRVTVVADQVAPPLADEGDVLSHYFYVELATGLHEVAPPGRKLPYRNHFRLETAGPGVLLAVRLVEGHIPIGAVEIHDLPADLPVGTPIDVDLHFRPDWTIAAEVGLPTVGREGRAVIEVPPVPVPSWDELLRLYDEIRAGWQERRQVARPEDLMRVGPQLDALLGDIAVLLNQREDPAKTRHRLLQADTLLRGVRIPGESAMHPPVAEFEQNLADLGRLCEALARKDPRLAAEHQGAIPGLRAAGHAAREAGNALDWHTVNEAVEARIDSVRRALTPPEQHRPPSAGNLRYLLLQDLEKLDRILQAEGQLSTGRLRDEAEVLRGDVHEVRAAVASVDLKDPDASDRLAGIYQGEVQPLGARVENWRRHAGSDGVIPIQEPGGGGRP